MNRNTGLCREPDWVSFMNALDVNNDSRIDFGEFITAAYNRLSLINKNVLKLAFETLDLNNDGHLSIEELREAFSGYMVIATDSGWQDMISEVDVDKDGQISYVEFETCMMKVLNLNYGG